MRWQRRTTYKPDLIVESTGFSIYPYGTDHFGTISVDRKRPADSSLRSEVTLKTRNAGFGPATNVTYSWDTDLQAFLESVGKVDASVVETAEFRAGRLLKLFDSKGRESTHNLRTQLRGKLPAIMADVSAGFYFPSVYLSLLLLSLNVLAKREEALARTAVDSRDRHTFGMGEVQGWPSLTLTLSCKDLGGSEHTKTFTVQPEVAMLHFGDVNSTERSASIAVTVRDYRRPASFLPSRSSG